MILKLSKTYLKGLSTEHRNTVNKFLYLMSLFGKRVTFFLTFSKKNNQYFRIGLF